jgi:alkylation response protein AidB-like acyl-CoA dehydrogenase
LTYLVVNTTAHATPGFHHQRSRTHGEPVRPGTPRLRDVFAAVEEGAFERERDDVPPFGAVDILRAAGFGALRIPRELGGAGATLPQLFETLIGLAAVDPNVAHLLRAHFFLVELRLAAFARGEQIKWLNEILAGAIFGSATTELGTKNTGGLNADRFQTTLTPSHDGSGWRLNGSKYYSTGTLYADWVAVVASVSGGSTGTAIIPIDRPGVRIEDDWDGMGQRLTASGSSHFDNVAVAADEVFQHQDEGHGTGYVPTFAQLWLTAVVAGILRAATDDAVDLLRGRVRTFSHGSSQSAVDDPLLHQVIGQLSTNAYAAEAVVASAASSLERAADSVHGDGEADQELLQQAAVDAARAKIAVDELAQRSGWQIFDVGGASATRAGQNLDRHWRNARTIASHNPSLYKTRAIGDLLVNGRPLPASALF